ncbi:LysR family transcriptional regulator [Burkholderia catarinensis]|uniref:LysR family transcriptional regulator n=1 Tax=Burkholderia catarinensis TaxID=1108140 RepID=UPI00091EFE13|nr:LysR family transcriptional regulator [Burkholderia catarinensis]KAG8152948.1 LysR family transcriptional regulator [Burkholderia catarinensis]
MLRQNVEGLIAFVAVAKQRSFTRAAAQMGVSQPALSQTIRDIERRLGVRLLTRTTRSVSLTEAGELLLRTIEPRFNEIETALDSLNAMRERPAGTIRISAGEHPAITILQPALARLLPSYPEINVEVVVDYRLIDIVDEGYDAGVRLGQNIAKDMIAVRIGADWRMAVAGSPSYFAKRPPPKTPEDLSDHSCINLRLPTMWSIRPWEFEKDGRKVKISTEGQLVFNNIALRLKSALDGLGLVYLPEDQVDEHVSEGRLVRVLDDWCPAYSGYHLYYPSRRHHSAAFALLVDTLRYRD